MRGEFTYSGFPSRDLKHLIAGKKPLGNSFVRRSSFDRVAGVGGGGGGRGERRASERGMEFGAFV